MAVCKCLESKESYQEPEAVYQSLDRVIRVITARHGVRSDVPGTP